MRNVKYKEKNGRAIEARVSLAAPFTFVEGFVTLTPPHASDYVYGEQVKQELSMK